MSAVKKIILASPHGFCAGVDRAIKMMDLALSKYGAPLYCLNEIVHNALVVESFTARGVDFVSALCDVPPGSVVLFSAHGVAPCVRKEAAQRGLRVLDATCPFVEKIHREVLRWAGEGKQIFLVGHRNHEEIVGISGEAPDSVIVVETVDEVRSLALPAGTDIAVATQTTLSLDEAEKVIAALEEVYPALEKPSRGDICYATLNRQKAVRAVAGLVDLVLVLGSRNSSNTNRLVEVARSEGVRAELVESSEVLGQVDFAGVNAVGLTAGASTPESVTDSVIAGLKKIGFGVVDHLEVVKENCALSIPAV